MNSNVLILSAGRRVELVQEFKNDLNFHFHDSMVFCTDMNPELSAACQIACKSFKVPRVTDERYIETVLGICIENNVGLVVPTIDTELLLLARNRDLFFSLGIHLIISDEKFISFCRDKRETAILFDFLSIDQPKILNSDNLSFPCFCKPYDGSCSVGAFALNSIDDLTQGLLEDPKNIFMELVPKTFKEYTVDAYYTRDSVLRCLVPRKRLEVRGGEVSKAITKKNFVYDYLIDRVKFVPGAQGCITFQFFVNEDELIVKGLEVNPRFGGGYPLTYGAGAHYPKWLIEEYLMNKIPDFYDAWDSELMMLRYDAKVLVREV